MYLTKSYEASANAYELAGLLGFANNKYNLENDFNVYLAVASDFTSLLNQANYSINREMNLKQVSLILEIYIKNLEVKNIINPDQFKELYDKNRSEIQREGLLNKDISI